MGEGTFKGNLLRRFFNCRWVGGWEEKVVTAEYYRVTHCSIVSLTNGSAHFVSELRSLTKSACDCE